MAQLTSTAVGDATSLASTSTGNTNSYVYDVFINHRGEVKKGLASDIYNRLIVDGSTRVFLDQQEFQRGENMITQIKGAIRTASVHVAIFSPRYADSEWCLNELVLMLESNSKIIPVFYNVQPSNLRWTSGGDRGYARALRELEKKRTIDSQPRYDSITIKKWRDALSTVANISGFELKACNEDEGQLVDKVVQRVLKLLTKPLVNVAKYPTGLDEKVKDVERMMLLQQQSEKARVVGIVGLGGVGKTTLATEFFDRQRSNYARSCFLHDVRENAANGSLNSLQSTLLKDLAGLNMEINCANEGIGKLKRYLSSSHLVLVVLDDVDHFDQMDALFSPLNDTIHSGSLIVVTSRNRDVLIGSDIPESSIYGLTGLNPHHSKELFCSYAFGESHPIVGFDEVVERFLNGCHGLPLSLKVLGAHLRGKRDLNHWEAQLRKNMKILPSDIHRRLRLSYDSLDEEEKQIFLDIACFFIGEHMDTAINIWDGSGWEGRLGFWKLENRCLVEVDSQNHIRMHDHLRDLGRDLAEKEPPRSELRLWRPTDNFLHDLSGQSSVRGIMLVRGNRDEQSLKNVAGSCNLSRLQLLWVCGDFVKSLFDIVQLSQLIYFHCENYPFSKLPSWLSKNLRVLYLKADYLETLWQHESQAPLQLRELYIKAPLLKLPKSIGKVKLLEEFVLETGYLETLPDEFCYMQSLKHVRLNCEKLTLLPDSVGNLTSLKSLDLFGCRSLQALPDSVGSLTSLQRLVLYGCLTLQTLPDSVGSLTSLQILEMHGCSALQTLPDSVGNLASLQSLYLGRCFALQALPDSVGSLTNLQILDLSNCSALRGLPDSVGSLMSLQSLDLRNCYTLRALPDLVGSLTSLQRLDLGACSALQALPDSVGSLNSLQSLDLHKCSALQSLPDSVESLTSLRSLDLRWCSSLQSLPDSVWSLTSLNFQSLELHKCLALQALPGSVGRLTSLQNLDLSWCSALQALPDSVGNLMRLQSLDLSECSTLQALPDSVGSLTSLQDLDLSWCSALQALPNSVGSLTNLQNLHLGGCSNLQALPDSVGSLTSLQDLPLSGCSALQVLPDSVGSLTNLQSLHLSWCSALQALPDSVGSLTSLKGIFLYGCSSLRALPDSVGRITSLRSLFLNRWSTLQALPDSVGSLTNLRRLDLSGCSTLQVLPDSMGNLKSHKILDLSWCSSFQGLPNAVRSLTSLENLDLSGCSTLQTFTDSVGSLPSLESLDLAGAPLCRLSCDPKPLNAGVFQFADIGELLEEGLPCMDVRNCNGLRECSRTAAPTTGGRLHRRNVVLKYNGTL